MKKQKALQQKQRKELEDANRQAVLEHQKKLVERQKIAIKMKHPPTPNDDVAPEPTTKETPSEKPTSKIFNQIFPDRTA